MLKKHEQLKIYDLVKAGYGVQEIANRVGCSLGTVYRYRSLEGELKSLVRDQYSKIKADFKDYEDLIEPYARKGKPALRDAFFATQQAGYGGGYHQFQKYFTYRRRELQPGRTILKLDTEPGEQAQVDWGQFGEITVNGKREKLYLFAYILSWSRITYLEFVVHQNQQTLQACHMRAFEAVGIPRTILYDNMKTVVARNEKLSNGERYVHITPAFASFARYYQFTPEACYPYHPQSKGKVEATIAYVRKHFPRVRPSSKVTLEGLNQELRNWMERTAYQRKHRTTGQRPIEMWQQEQASLSFPGDLPPYNYAPFDERWVNQHGMLMYKGNFYCVPIEFARKKLEIREISDHGRPILEVYHQSIKICDFNISLKKGEWVHDAALVEREKVETEELKRKKSIKTIVQDVKYDVEVETRDLNYYALALDTYEGGI